MGAQAAPNLVSEDWLQDWNILGSGQDATGKRGHGVRQAQKPWHLAVEAHPSHGYVPKSISGRPGQFSRPLMQWLQERGLVSTPARLGLQAGKGPPHPGVPCSPGDAIDHGRLVGQNEFVVVQEAGALGLAHTLSLVVQVGALRAVAAVQGHGTGMALSRPVRE